MTINKVTGMYFSGTDTTKKIVTAAAKTIAQELPGSIYNEINFTPLKARDKVYTFSPSDAVVFGTPVIAGRVPNVLLKFLNTLEGEGALAIPVVLYGNRNFDDALIELRNILEDRGFHTIAGAAFIGEHSFSKVLAAGRPNDNDMEICEDFAKAAAEKIIAIEAGGIIPEPIEVEGQTPIRDYYKPRDRKGNFINILKVKPKLDESKCNKCGICVEACPMGSIKPDAPGVVDGICIKCCGCEKKCPEGALYFNDAGYLYHKEELELGYPEPKEPSLFL